MSQYSKLLKRIYSLDKNLRFDEIKKVMDTLGYTMNGPSGGSSHKTFRKKGCPTITIPQHEPLRQVYVAMVRDALERELNENEDEEND